MKCCRYIIIPIIVCIFYLLLVPYGCKDPDEFKPPPDSLIDPPGAPVLITPPTDTEYVLIPVPGYIDVYFAWNAVSEAESYELEYSENANFSNGQMFMNTSTVLIKRFVEPIDLYWHVRAGSNYWTWYTDWSETRYFRIRPPL